MKTLIVVHGGESFTSEAEYQKFLRETYVSWQSEPWTPTEEKSSWKQEIAKNWHAQGNQVFMPVFPHKINARYNEWKIVFEGIVSKLSREDEVTLVGGSLGGCFLLKYFSEQNQENSPFVISSEAEKSLSESPYEHERNVFSKAQEKGMPTAGQKRIQINQIHLIAACISEGDFTAPTNYAYLAHLGDRVHIWHAEDDMVVPFATAQELANHLSQAKTHFFSSEKGYGHFHGVERIPELEVAIFG